MRNCRVCTALAYCDCLCDTCQSARFTNQRVVSIDTLAVWIFSDGSAVELTDAHGATETLTFTHWHDRPDWGLVIRLIRMLRPKHTLVRERIES